MEKAPPTVTNEECEQSSARRHMHTSVSPTRGVVGFDNRGAGMWRWWRWRACPSTTNCSGVANSGGKQTDEARPARQTETREAAGTLSKLLWVLNNPQRPLHHILDRQWSVSSQTLRQLHCLTDRYREHFLPPAAKLLKASALTWQMAVEVLQFIFVIV